MPSSLDLVIRLRDLLLKRRWAIAAAAALITIIVEMVEHRPANWSEVDAALLREVVIFGVVGPLFIGGTFSVLARAWSERSMAMTHVGYHRELSRQLASSQDWEALTSLIVRYPRTLVPTIGTSLFVYDHLEEAFDLAAEWWDRGRIRVPPIEPPRTTSFCGGCASARLAVADRPFPLRCADSPGEARIGSRYCLPLVRSDTPIAFLYLYFPAGTLLSIEELNLLGGMAPAMAVAIHDSRPQRAEVIQVRATEIERKRIARDLHDTLGQSLAYLHLKLDQLTGDDALGEIGAIRKDLERMRDVSNEAYQKVRATLDDLREDTAPDLTAALIQRLRIAEARAGFNTEVVTEGQPRPLLYSVQRHVLYIFREALANVEKHAHAEWVRLSLNWTDDSLAICLVDGGQGFDRNSLQPNGHYGVTIMKERAKELGGQLEIVSSLGSGTEVQFTLPLDAAGSVGGDPQP
jgi:signal transduction histidine kinase